MWIDSMVDAVEEQDMLRVALLLEERSVDELNTVYEEFHNGTLVSYMTQENFSLGLELLLKRGVSVNIPNDSGVYPLHEASMYESAECAKLLLSHGADTKHRTKWGNTALHLAAREANSEVLNLLLQYGSEIDAKTNSPAAETALHLAVVGSCTESVQFLLKAGADVNAEDATGDKPLHRAVRHASPYSIPLLVAGGTDVNSAGAQGWTPLHIASYYGLDDCAEELVKLGASRDIPDHLGCSAMYHADPEMKKVLDSLFATNI